MGSRSSNGESSSTREQKYASEDSHSLLLPSLKPVPFCIDLKSISIGGGVGVGVRVGNFDNYSATVLSSATDSGFTYSTTGTGGTCAAAAAAATASISLPLKNSLRRANHQVPIRFESESKPEVSKLISERYENLFNVFVFYSIRLKSIFAAKSDL